MTGGRSINPIGAWKEGPAVTAEKALTAEADWQDAESRVAEAKTAAGTGPASSAAIFFENSEDIKRSDPNQHNIWDTMAIEKIIFITNNPQTSKGHPSAADQRFSKRFEHEAPLIIKDCDNGTYAYGRMYNYSRGGIYFESDAVFKPGTCVRVDIERAQHSLAADSYYAAVRWCKEIFDAVVLYDYGIGIEFDRKINRSAAIGRLRLIQGGSDQNDIPDLLTP